MLFTLCAELMSSRMVNSPDKLTVTVDGTPVIIGVGKVWATPCCGETILDKNNTARMAMILIVERIFICWSRLHAIQFHDKSQMHGHDKKWAELVTARPAITTYLIAT